MKARIRKLGIWVEETHQEAGRPITPPTRKAVAACRDQGVDDLLIGGGVAANSRLRALAQERCDRAGIRLRVPRPGLCTDNGAMVAALGAQFVARGRTPSLLDLPADSSMPVTSVQA